MKLIARFSALLMLLGMVACGGGSTENKGNGAANGTANKEPEYLYGIDIAGYTIANDTVRSGETVGGILGRRGVSAVMVDRLDICDSSIGGLLIYCIEEPC